MAEKITPESNLDPYPTRLAQRFRWAEPDEPPDSQAVLEIGQPQTRVEGLLLRANIPSTVLLRGPADLRFQSFTIKLTARSLVRNLAKPEWGSTRAITGTNPQVQEILLAAPARIEAVGVRGNSLASPVEVKYKEGDYKTWVSSMALASITFAIGKKQWSGLHEQPVETQGVQLNQPDTQAHILLRSPSLPSRVALALGDDTPAQLFPAEMALRGSVTSRDLTAQINAAWRRAAHGESGDKSAEVALRITSATDGIVQVDLAGEWSRHASSEEFPLSLDGASPETIETSWPFDAAPDAHVMLHLTGRTAGGRRLGWPAGSPSFSVRASERLEVAQGFRLMAPEAPPQKREVLAVWLLLPRLPESEERLLLRLAEGKGEPPAPAGTDLGSAEVTLPVDTSAYQATSSGFWYRAELKKPVVVDGAQAASPLFVVVSGRETGSPLAHRSTGSAPESALRIPVGAGAGVSLFRNLDRNDHWEVQSFNRQAAHWLIDLELTPSPAEYADLITFAFGNGKAAPLPLAGLGALDLVTTPRLVERPPDTTAMLKPGSKASTQTLLGVTITSSIQAEVKAQLFLMRPITN